MVCDPYLQNWTPEQAAAVGWFPSTAVGPSEEIALPQTKLQRNLQQAQGRPVAVLVTTGCFAPVHPGHLNMMAYARQVVEAQGFHVAAGYFCPDHQEYVDTKPGAAVWNAGRRIHALLQHTMPSPWLEVDTGPIFLWTGAVNYTDIVARIARILPEVQVFYVCGSDNARFAFAFQGTPIRTIVADRTGQAAPALPESATWVKMPPETLGLSSTLVRQTGEVAPHPRPSKVLLRVADSDDPAQVERLREILRQYFTSVQIRQVSQQRAEIQGRVAEGVSLDPLLPLAANLAISRLYDSGGWTFAQFVNRPGTLSISEQLHQIREDVTDQILLVDDDVCSGATMRYATQLLGVMGISVLGYVALEQGSPDLEILDARDFLQGAGGGLVVGTPDGPRRVPYILPYVHPTIRASIPPEHADAFSAQIRALWDRI